MPLTKATYSMINGAIANVLDYGAVGDGVTDDSTAFDLAIATGKRVYVPKGKYSINATIATRTIIEGDGSTETILYPHDVTKGILTYTYSASTSPFAAYWTYHSEIRNVGFSGKSPTYGGYGFTFGGVDPTTNPGNAEYANNVKFYGCYFTDLTVGVKFPFGNIGSEFYSCGFQYNTYGVYLLSNNSGSGDVMHAGNKYFYGGEFHKNTVAVYYSDQVDGGGVAFYGTIIENNLCALYYYSTGSCLFTPFSFNDVWFEKNGAVDPAEPSTIYIDTWSGSTVTRALFNKRSFIIDGTGGQVYFNRGFFTDCYIKGTAQTVTVTDSRVENNQDNSGYTCTVDDPSTSSIIIRNPNTNYGPPRSKGCIIEGSPFLGLPTISNNGLHAYGRWFISPARRSKISAYGPSRIYSADGTTAITLNGSFSLTGSIVSDGRIYDSCNEFTRSSFLSSEYDYLSNPDSSFTTTAGWYVITFDVKQTVGTVSFSVTNLGTAQMATELTAPSNNVWHTIAAYAYSPGGQTMQLWVRGSGSNATWRMSAIQIHTFPTQRQAQDFITGGVYAE